jgi:hypothetical protein
MEEEALEEVEDQLFVITVRKPGHYARDFPQPPATCMYCHATDHETKDCPTLLIKIQDKRNQTNQNVQWIGVENREEDGKKINIVTRGGAKTGEDATKKDQDQYQWVRKNTTPEQKFDAHKEKEIFKEARQEILKENIVSTSGTKPVDEIPVYDMPSLFDQTNQEKSSEQVSNLRNFLGACVKLLSDKNSLQVLHNLLEKCNPGEEGVKRVNQVHKKRRTNREFRLNANIGDFNMGDIILDLGSEVNVLPKKTWEAMGEPQLGYSPIQLKLENQHRVVPIGRLKGIPVDLDGVHHG